MARYNSHPPGESANRNQRLVQVELIQTESAPHTGAGRDAVSWGLCAVLVLSICAAARAESAEEYSKQGDRAEDTGDHVQAALLYRQAVEQVRSGGTPDEKQLAAYLVSLGQAMAGQGRRAEANGVFQEGLAMRRRVLGDNDMATLTTMNYVASNYLSLGDDAQAEALFGESARRLRAGYPGSLQLGRALGGLAAVRIWRGDDASAQPFAEEALKIAIAQDGDSSVDTALAYSTVALCHLAARRTDRALPLYRKSLAIYEKVLGPNNPRVAAARSQMALVLIVDGRLGPAEDELRKAQSSLSASCPHCDVEMCNIETNIAMLRMRQGNLKEADRLLTHVLSIQESGGWSGRAIAATVKSLDQIHGRTAEAKEAARPVYR
jgi:tetratricopeptide (TPR) repeat protein